MARSSAAWFVLPFLALVGTPTTGAAEPAQTPACVQARDEARYIGFAYDHWVHIRNTCGAAADCSVSTNVNPDPVDVRVPAGEGRSVLTFRANPSRRFTIKMSCTLDE